MGGATFSPPQPASRLASLTDFFLLFPHCGTWSQAKLALINKMTSPTVTLPLKIDIEKQLVELKAWGSKIHVI